MRYRTIVADPPWDQGPVPSHMGGRVSLGRGARTEIALPYSPMSLAGIAAVDVGSWAEPDARLFLWTTNRFLPAALGQVLPAWGFDYRQTLVWDKRAGGSPFVASVAPNHAEYLLVAVRGNPPRSGSLQSSVVSVPAHPGGGHRRHSAKPEAFLDLVEAVSPGPYLELFARRNRLGWDTWGNESLEHVALENL
jgi:N6-adenosine-specific RNA methylase IME4